MSDLEWIKWNGAHLIADPAEVRAWLARHAPDNKARLESVAASTGRDNYGLCGKAGKRAKSHDAGKWVRFQESVKA